MSRTELQEWHHIGGDKIYRYNNKIGNLNGLGKIGV